MIMDKVTGMLEFLENNIDEKHCRDVERHHLDALYFKSGSPLPLVVITRPEEELLPRDEAFDNPEVMLHNELLESEPFLGNIMNSVYTRDDFPFHIRSNHGIAMTHSILGGEYLTDQKNMPWALPLDIPVSEYRRKWEDRPFDIKNNDVVKRVVDTYEHFKFRFSKYPKCGKYIRLSHPNLNAPFQSAQSLIGNNFFLELYDNPDDVHWLIKRITEMYIELFKIIDPLMNNSTSGNTAMYIHGGIYPCRAVLKNDTAVAMLSEDHYLEFVRPYDEIISRELGPICIHYCGASKPFHFQVIDVPGLRGVNFGDPQMQDMDTVISELNRKNIAVVGWGHGQGPEFLYQTLNGRKITGFTLDCTVPDREKAAEYIRRYREQGPEGLKCD
jgi:hypothetical protein